MDPAQHSDNTIGKRELITLMLFGLWHVYCHGLFAHPLNPIEKLCSLIAAIPVYSRGVFEKNCSFSLGAFKI